MKRDSDVDAARVCVRSAKGTPQCQRISTCADRGRGGKACDRHTPGQLCGRGGLVRGRVGICCRRRLSGMQLAGMRTQRKSAFTPRRNPWIDKAKATADFGDEEYMVRNVLHRCKSHRGFRPAMDVDVHRLSWTSSRDAHEVCAGNGLHRASCCTLWAGDAGATKDMAWMPDDQASANGRRG